MTDLKPAIFFRAALLLAALLLPSNASADAVVTLCSADNEPMAGMDLRRAIAAGGHITFNCPAGTTIPVSMTHTVSVDTQIDGGGSITLDARGTMSMFMMSNAPTVLTLNGLTLRRGIPLMSPSLRSLPCSTPSRIPKNMRSFAVLPCTW